MVSLIQYIRNQRLDLPIAPTQADCQGRTYVVTGANTGLGFECAQHLVRLHAKKVILACRSIARGEAAKTRIEENTGQKEVAEVWQLDVGSYDSVKAFASRFETLDRVDAVIENASVAMLEYEKVEGLESTLTINCVGTFLLAALILPRMRHHAQAFGTQPHLVIVGSEVAFGMKGQLEKIDGDLLDGLTESAKVSMANRYQTSKLVQFYAIREIASLQSQSGSDVVLNLVSPGMCKTELARHVGPLLRIVFSTIQFLVARTAEMGSRTLLHAAFAGPSSHGKYLSACQVEDQLVPEWVTNSAGATTQDRVWTSLTRKLESISPGCTRVGFGI